MRSRKVGSSHINSQKIAFYFVLSIGALVVVSLIFKAVVLVSQSRFDGVHRFTISVSEDHKKEVAVISADPSRGILSVLDLSQGQGDAPLSRFLEIPIEGRIKLTNPTHIYSLDQLLKMENTIAGKDIFFIMLTFLTDYTHMQTNLAFLDIAKFAWQSKNIPKTSVKFGSIGQTLSDSAIDRVSNSLFIDSEIQRENQSIQIINATGVSGLGNRLARFITNMGGTVVAVSTSEKEEENSRIIKRVKYSYTFNRLSQVLSFREGLIPTPSPTPEEIILEEKEKAPDNKESFISDIILVIGKKSLSSLVF